MRKFLCLTSLFVSACLFQNENGEKGDSPVPLQLVPVSSQTAAVENRIDLDTITGSSVQYFIIQNNGVTNINDVEMVSDNPNFSFQPSKISVLAPAKQLNVQQIVALKIKNGSGSAGGGYDSLLKAGPNQTAVSISGYTTDKANNVQALSQKITMTAYVKRADIKAASTSGAINFSPSNGGKALSGVSPDAYSNYSVQGDSITLTNTGNVDLRVTVWPGTSLDVKADLNIKVNGSLRIPIPSTFAFDGGGVTCDPARFLVSRDGRTYIGLEPPPPDSLRSR